MAPTPVTRTGLGTRNQACGRQKRGYRGGNLRVGGISVGVSGLGDVRGGASEERVWGRGPQGKDVVRVRGCQGWLGRVGGVGEGPAVGSRPPAPGPAGSAFSRPDRRRTSSSTWTTRSSCPRPLLPTGTVHGSDRNRVRRLSASPGAVVRRPKASPEHSAPRRPVPRRPCRPAPGVRAPSLGCPRLLTGVHSASPTAPACCLARSPHRRPGHSALGTRCTLWGGTGPAAPVDPQAKLKVRNPRRPAACPALPAGASE